MRLVPAIGLVLALGCNSVGPFAGGALRGDVVAEPVEDWSFAAGVDRVWVETRPENPKSFHTWCVVDDGNLYLPSGEPTRRLWVMDVLGDSRVRIRIEGRIYQARLVRVLHTGEFAGVRARFIAKYRLNPEEVAQRELWFFRAAPR